MTPAERLAALKAIAEGIGAAITEAERDVQASMDSSGADRFRTDLGSVSMVVRKPRLEFDEDRLLSFAQDNAEWNVETITRVRPAMRSHFVILDDVVVYAPTGEEVDFVSIKPGSKGLMVKLTPDAKLQAQELLIDRVESITGLLGIEAGP